MRGELPATARSAVLKTAGTASNCMGIDTSAPRHKTIKQHFDRSNQAWFCSLPFLKKNRYNEVSSIQEHRVLTVLLLTSIVLSGKTAVSKTVVLSSNLSAGATQAGLLRMLYYNNATNPDCRHPVKYRLGKKTFRQVGQHNLALSFG